MRTLELRDLRTRDTGDGSLEFDGIAVPYDTEITYGGIAERFARGAFDTDQAVGTPLLWAHDRAEPVGHITHAADTPVGLMVTGRVLPTSRGADAITLMRAGSLRGLSVGFEPTDREQTPTGITYTRATLHELSLTPLPAYADATVTATREDEEPSMSETRETAAPAVDLTPLTERLDSIESRMIAKRDDTPARQVSVPEAFTRQLLDWKDTRQVRALADVLSSGNAGVLPPDWSSQVVGYVDAMRYTINQAGSIGFPSSGTGLTVPSITQDTLVDPRGVEKTDVPSRALTTAATTYAIEWFAGGVDVAMELIEQSEPAVMQIIARNLLQQYAARTDAAAHANAVAAATHHGAPLDTSTYGALVNDIIGVGETIRAACGEFGNKLVVTTADWTAILGLLDGDGRRVFATGGSTNADGSARLDAATVDVGGVTVAHSPRAVTSVQFSETSYLIAEKPPVSLQQPNVSLMGVDIGVLGAIVSVPAYPAGIVSYEV